jgi:hypothetical protein
MGTAPASNGAIPTIAMAEIGVMAIAWPSALIRALSRLTGLTNSDPGAFSVPMESERRLYLFF